MKRVWVVPQLLIAGGVALFALVASWDAFVHLATSDVPKFMRAAILKASGPDSDGIGSVSAGYAGFGGPVLAVLPSLVLWRAYAWMAAANLGGRAAGRLAGIHKWTAIGAAIVLLTLLLCEFVFTDILGPERGSLLMFALLVMPGLFLNPSLSVALAGGQAASALAGVVFFFGDNRARA
jgi:hypothetical protein